MFRQITMSLKCRPLPLLALKSWSASLILKIKLAATLWDFQQISLKKSVFLSLNLSNIYFCVTNLTASNFDQYLHSALIFFLNLSQQIAHYTSVLNSLPTRQKFGKLEPRNLQMWFKNRRSKGKRIEQSSTNV